MTARFTLALCTLLVLWPQLSGAQEVATFEAGGGYSALRDTEREQTYWAGWYASGGWNAEEWLTLVGEVSAHRKSSRDPLIGLRGEEQFLALMAGPRMRFTQARAVPFIHVLAGVVRFGATESLGSIQSDDHASHAAVEVGGGLDVRLNQHIAARVGVGYRRVLGEPGGPVADEPGLVRRSYPRAFAGGLNQVRVTVGAVVAIGGRD